MDDTSITYSDQRTFRVLLLLSGHNPRDFSVRECSEDRVEVRGPSGTASYPSTSWVTGFARHLYEGLFERIAA